LGTENTYTIRETGAKSASLSDFGLVSLGLYRLRDRLTAYRHHSFTGTVLPGLLEAVPVDVKHTFDFSTTDL
jgi:hypothetical protein